MTPLSIVAMCLSMVLVWGGCLASVLFLRHRTELSEYPPGGLDDDRDETQIVQHDT